MRLGYLNIINFLFGVFLSGIAYGQNLLIPEAPEDFHDFLILQGEVPGLTYRFLTSHEVSQEKLGNDTIYAFIQMDSGLVSRQFSDFSRLNTLEEELRNAYVDFKIEYLVYSDTETLEGTREYLGNLIRGGDFIVKFEESQPSDDIVSLAAYSPYFPLQKIKLRFVSDLKLLLVTILIVLFFVVALGMIGAMILLKARKNNRENLKKEYDRLIIDPLTSLLFEKELQELIDLDQVTINDYFPQSMLSKALFKDILIERIIGLNKKMKGDFKEKLKALYKKLKLDERSIGALKSKNWDQVAMGLVQINEMDLKEALPKVMSHANSSNFQIRSQAVATLLNLSEEVNLTFLRDQTYPLSLWQQMNYLRIIRFANHYKKIHVDTLFESKNSSIRIFGYRLVKILGRVDLIEKVAAFAMEVSDEEKIEILEIYEALGAHMEVDFVNFCLTSSNPDLVLAASKAAGSIGNSVSAEILLGLLNSGESSGRVLVYAKSLNNIDKEYLEKVDQEGSNPEITEIKNHILDPLLLHV